MCTKHETLLVSLLSQNKFQILGQIGQGLGCGMEIFPRYLNCVSSKWDAYVRNCNVIGLALGFQWFIFGVAVLAILYFRGRFVCMVIPEALQKSIHLRNFFIPIYFSLYKWKFYLFSFIFIFFQLLFPKSFGEIFTLTRFLGLIETQANGKFRRLFTSRLGSSLITLTSWYVVLWSHSHVFFFFPPRSRLATQKLLMLCWDFCYKHKKSYLWFFMFLLWKWKLKPSESGKLIIDYRSDSLLNRDSICRHVIAREQSGWALRLLVWGSFDFGLG